MSLTIDKTSYRSPNYDPGTIAPQGILLHSDEGTRFSSLPWLCNPQPNAPQKRVSCTAYVCRNGDTFELVSPWHRSWHAGPGDYAGLQDWNSAIGIELEHKDGQDWPRVQLDTAAQLCRLYIDAYKIPKERIAAHRWVATPRGRKSDPTNWSDQAIVIWISALFLPQGDPWEVWSARGFPIAEHERAWAIAQTWLQNRWLGAATSPHLYSQNGDGKVFVWFENGGIYHLPGRSAVVVKE